MPTKIILANDDDQNRQNYKKSESAVRLCCNYYEYAIDPLEVTRRIYDSLLCAWFQIYHCCKCECRIYLFAYIGTVRVYMPASSLLLIISGNDNNLHGKRAVQNDYYFFYSSTKPNSRSSQCKIVRANPSRDCNWHKHSNSLRYVYT